MRIIIWILFWSISESKPCGNRSGLRSYWYFRTNWEGHFGVQCVWYRASTLVRYVGIPEKTYCSMAYTERSRRGDWRQKGLNFLKYIHIFLSLLLLKNIIGYTILLTSNSCIKLLYKGNLFDSKKETLYIMQIDCCVKLVQIC